MKPDPLASGTLSGLAQCQCLGRKKKQLLTQIVELLQNNKEQGSGAVTLSNFEGDKGSRHGLTLHCVRSSTMHQEREMFALLRGSF